MRLAITVAVALFAICLGVCTCFQVASCLLTNTPPTLTGMLVSLAASTVGTIAGMAVLK